MRECDANTNAYFSLFYQQFFLNRPTVLCKILGVYQIGYHNRVTGKRSMEQVAVMQVSLVL
jgi:1-phosphatidylinositol-3-phosphate 5-kinase